LRLRRRINRRVLRPYSWRVGGAAWKPPASRLWISNAEAGRFLSVGTFHCRTFRSDILLCMLDTARKLNVPAALGASAVCLVFVVFVLVYDDLRYLHFAQVMSSVVMTLAIAVVLFSMVPARAPVAAAVGLGGAALFYWKLLPVIMVAAFPPPATQVIHGGIHERHRCRSKACRRRHR
jgi:hypothetical protein